MADEQLKHLVSQGLEAMHAGGEVAKQATQETQDDATHPELKQALEQGTQTAAKWQQRIEQALQQVGGGGDGPGDNPVMNAHYEVSKRIRAEASDPTTRDLGIVAAGQLALHYWIAAFGTMANYTNKLGLSEAARAMKMCDEEAKQADEAHTQLAEKLLA